MFSAEPAPPRKWQRLKTGTLLFLVLSLALAPLGAIGMHAGVQSMWKSDADRLALLNTATIQQARRLAGSLRRDMTDVRSVLSRVALDDLTATCELMFRTYPGRANASPQPADLPGAAMAPNPVIAVQIMDVGTGANVCTPGVPDDLSSTGRPIGTVRIADAGRAIILTAATIGDGRNIELTIPMALMEARLGVAGRIVDSDRAFVTPFKRIAVDADIRTDFAPLALESTAPVGTFGMALVAQADRALFDGPEAAIGLAVPIGMWLLAALLSWLIVDTVLLTPVSRLRRRLKSYQPGDLMPRDGSGRLAAREISALNDMTATLAERVSNDKRALAQSLDHQRALTREVHHRVKNNLQIIASLINLHSRAAATEDAVDSYRIIHRRVEALAVVHRNLQAEGEAVPGVTVGGLLADLVNGLREGAATATGDIILNLSASTAKVSQDTALPVAFFVTELLELALMRAGAAQASVSFSLVPGDSGLAVLAVESAGLRRDQQHGVDPDICRRVVTGLARQLRQPVEMDDDSGRYALTVPLL